MRRLLRRIWRCLADDSHVAEDYAIAIGKITNGPRTYL